MSPCPDPRLGALLHAYELRLLSEDDDRRFELHMLECEDCASAVQEFEEATRLMRDDGVIRELLAESSVIGTQPVSIWRRLWRRLWPKPSEIFPDSGTKYWSMPLSVLFKPAILWLLILVLFVPAYLGVDRLIWQEEHISYELGWHDQVRSVQTTTLSAVRAVPDNIFHKNSGLNGTIRFEFPGAIPGRNYCIEITYQDGTTIARIEDFTGFDQAGMGEIVFPHTLMKIGKYRLTIKDIAPGNEHNNRTYWFRVVE